LARRRRRHRHADLLRPLEDAVTLPELVGALELLGLLFYAFGFIFWLGFWLEDCEGRFFRRPFFCALFWFVMLVPVSFSIGITAAQWHRRFRKAVKR
jgi:hypothetical protein